MVAKRRDGVFAGKSQRNTSRVVGPHRFGVVGRQRGFSAR
jgi:hypothetical protein